MTRTMGHWSHGICDYALVVLLAMGPSIAGFAGRQASWSYLFAVLLLVLTVVTRSPLGVLKLVSFPLHGAVELLIALMLLALPWVANFANGIHSRNFYVATGMLMLALWFLTDFRMMRSRPPIEAAGRAEVPEAKAPAERR